jgi:hypothetical protein
MLFSVRAVMAVSVILFGVSLGGAAVAQGGVPAEQPPGSFRGEQYIDSRGCVFLRTGTAAQTNWVPRVNGARQHICGQQPSVAGTAIAAAPARAPLAIARPAVTVAAPVIMQPVAPSTQPRAVVPAPVQIAPATGGCPGMDAIANRYTSSTGRCGPQAVHPGDAARRGAALQQGATGTAQTAAILAPIVVPAGYRPAFDDGRFNAFRAVGTAAGEAQMDLIWTRSVPRRLVDRSTMSDMSALFPGLVYPFIDMATQNANLASTLAAQNLSARAAPRSVAVVPGDQFVQAARFTDRAAADAARAALASTGMPTRMGGVQGNNGMTYVVLAGPFDTPAALQSGLTAARAAGFTDATTRR